MIYRPWQISAFEFAMLAARRAEQLRSGCVPRVEGGHKFTVTAQLEVIAGKVVRAVEGRAQDSPDAVERYRHREQPRIVRMPEAV